jgi:FkbM family methyltransferase
MFVQNLKWLYRAWRYRYRLERAEIRLLLEHLSAGDVAVDVGAHKGAYTYWMRQAVGPSGKVYAFEPQPVLAARLSSLVSSSGYTNVVIENLGLSSSSGTMMLNVPGEGTSPSASFEAGEAGSKSYPVQVTTLDDYFYGREEPRVRLLKCDAEGHELEVFRGARRLLSEAGPCLLFECERRHRKSGRVDDVFDWLQDLGYRGYFIDRAGARDIREFDPGIHQAGNDDPGSVNNFLFLPSAKVAV